MKILLIKPPLALPRDFKGMARFAPPLGLGYIAAVLEKNNYEVTILDAGIENWRKINQREDGIKYVGMGWDDITKRVAKENPDIVGIFIMTVDAVNAHNVARSVKEVDKNIIVVAGGPHVCVRQTEVISDPNIDIAVAGEGEYVMLDLVQELEKENPDFTKIKGIWFKENGSIKKTEPRNPIMNLNELPFPARHLMHLDKYFKASKYLQGSRNIPERGASIITSRGCPFGCVFCSIRLSMGNFWRGRNPENVIAEIEELVEKYKVKYIGFEDDNLTLHKERIHKICDLIIEKSLNKKFTWGTPNGVRADRLDEPLLRKMKEAGCKDIIVAPESGNQWVLDNIIKKKLDLKTVENVVGICKKIGVISGCYFVIGNPGETLEQIEDTVRFANKMRALGSTPFCFIAWPYYGTDLYKIAKEKGYLLKDEKELEIGLLNLEAMIKTPEFSPEQLYEKQKEIQGETETSEILELIRTRPLDSLRCFLIHPIFISKYLIKKVLK